MYTIATKGIVIRKGNADRMIVSGECVSNLIEKLLIAL